MTTPISTCAQLPARVRTALTCAGIRSVEQLLSLTGDQLRKLPDISRKQLPYLFALMPEDLKGQRAREYLGV